MMWKFIGMSLCFSLNHGCVTTVMVPRICCRRADPSSLTTSLLAVLTMQAHRLACLACKCSPNHCTWCYLCACLSSTAVAATADNNWIAEAALARLLPLQTSGSWEVSRRVCTQLVSGAVCCRYL